MRYWLFLVFVCQLSFAQESLYSAFEKKRDWFESRQIVTIPLKKNFQPQYLNRLIYSDSPYLLSHALQPINWQQWTKDTIEKANAANKLIYLSIGYDTCHWCHVLSNETYLDTEVAELLNANFINVKVDREVSPNIDAKYRYALESMTGNPGWPIQVIITPDGDILWIDSYQPKNKLMQVFATLANKFEKLPAQMNAYAKSLSAQLLSQGSKVEKVDNIAQVRSKLLALSLEVLTSEQGGKGPRFLRANWLNTLLNEAIYTDNPEILRIVKRQIDELIKSPTYDFIDGGMHRYAEDGYWQEPHFEKMLYDQALLIKVLVRLYAITDQPDYLDFAIQTIEFVEQDFFSGDYYYSSLSALSDGIEGAYYKTTNKIPSQNERIGVVNQLLYLRELSLPDNSILRDLSANRVYAKKPFADTKGILAWNMHYVLAILDVYNVTMRQDYKYLVTTRFNKVIKHYIGQQKVHRITTESGPSTIATAEDYALLIQAMIGIYSVTIDQEYLLKAIKLHTDMISSLDVQGQIGISTDTQLASATASSIEALKALYRVTGERKFKRQVDSLTKSELITPFALSQFSLVSASDMDNHAIIAPYFFGGGNGIAAFEMIDEELFLVLSLKEGWHVNANEVNNKRLIPTSVKIVGVGAYPLVEYPHPIVKSVSFMSGSLNLFKGKIKIKLDSNALQRESSKKYVEVQLQVCSESLCLFPEKFKLVVGPNVN